MYKILFYAPVHVVNWTMTHIAPKCLFTSTYAPASISIQEQEQTMRNKVRLASYYTKRMLR